MYLNDKAMLLLQHFLAQTKKPFLQAQERRHLTNQQTNKVNGSFLGRPKPKHGFIKHTHLLSLDKEQLYILYQFGESLSRKTVPAGTAENYIPPTLLGLILTPGPMVEATTQDFTYWPLEAAGFAFTMAPSRAEKFSCSFSVPKETLPMGQ